MFSTQSLGSLKSIFPSIHHPLPLNQHRTQKLLNSITKSFRAQLDAEHGWTPEPAQIPAGSAPAVSYLPTAATSKSDAVSRRRPTDRHMHAILDNPLFSYNGSPKKFASSDVGGQAGTDPKAVFEIAVARGIMTIPRAHGFLLKVKQNIEQSAVISVKDAIKESGAGLLVLKWLRASGQERNLLYFQDQQQFSKLLLYFMLAEGLDGLAWQWLERLVRIDANHPELHSMLYTLVNAKHRNVVELDDAYKLMLQGQSLFSDNSVSPGRLNYAWKDLAWETTAYSWRHKLPAVDLYDAFSGVLGANNPKLEMYHAHLELHHPARPSPDRAIKYLSKTGPQLVDSSPVNDSQKQKMWRRFQLTSLTLDTVQHLTQMGDFSQAESIFHRLRPYFLYRFAL
ncbi:hypothetical protein B0H66DRAFT_256786 [Apodospora peruviana]|uniref:Uncharacterized protein n=1 Tax=Apodospora peruviana TaxID=516989 RepID=A0AAE0I5M9_9PEZI|nr:hypothetical protein B0H66DRAFT_256786 [Apodospora peruviana]